MQNERGDGGVSNTKIWMVLLGIILLFILVISYARHINIKKQEAVPVVARYTNYAYGVNLRYPPEWGPRGGGAYDRYEGDTGFFSLSAGGALSITIDDMVETMTRAKDLPYGSEPYVQSIVIDGQPARLIMPSPDQREELSEQAALIVEYPKPKVIGPNTYKFLVFWSDRANIQDIASSITFVR